MELTKSLSERLEIIDRYLESPEDMELRALAFAEFGSMAEDQRIDLEDWNRASTPDLGHRREVFQLSQYAAGALNVERL